MAQVSKAKFWDMPMKVLIVYQYTGEDGALIRDGTVIEVVDKRNVFLVFKEKFDKMHPKTQFKILTYFTQDGRKIK
jgi:hypothetical protein